jgi:TIR domain/Protein of unknown function (DUF1045)
LRPVSAQIFISHVHEDSDFAKAIASWLEASLLHGVRCFVSTDSGIPLGRAWFAQINAALADSAIMLVLASRTSASQRWIYFESGAGFIRGIPVVPICIAGMTTAELEPPLNALQAIDVPSEESERQLLALVANAAGLSAPSPCPSLPLPTRLSVDSARQAAAAHDPLVVFENTADPAFVHSFRSLTTHAKHVVMVGTGLNVLYHPRPADLLGSTSQCNWDIYVANPYSPSVEARLREEETGSPKPPVGKVGLIARLDTLLEVQKRRPSDGGRVTVRLFSHYPTISFFIVDDRHYFFYPYGYVRLGDYSPVIYCARGDPKTTSLVSFLDSQYELVKGHSVDAMLARDLHSGNALDSQSRRHVRRQLIPIAVYIVPDSDTDLYHFGSTCMGYDLRHQADLQSPWPARYTRSAAEFGFHLTVADALYFVDPQSLEMLASELRALAGEFRAFDLSLTLTAGFPDASSVSLVCQDDTGSIEALHHEMVARCYRRAVASNYSPLFGEQRVVPRRSYAESTARADLMIERYHAPYILNAFRPHFSLLSQIESSQMENVTASLNAELPHLSTSINSICLLTKPSNGQHWAIRDEFSFKLPRRH